jgi:excinuclease ABC subunit A
VVIEHNLDVVACADWVIDLGPEGGDKGGEIVTEGTPEMIAKVAGSYTGHYLKDVLGRATENATKTKKKNAPETAVS